ncbi:MAG: hypothetical protein AAGF24_04045 [Cyanobacteria bacterium P01_H01_bin.121]
MFGLSYWILMLLLSLILVGTFPAYAQSQIQDSPPNPAIVQMLQSHYSDFSISNVTVVDNYLMGNWRDQEGGGNVLWQYSPMQQQWNILAEGGGVMNLRTLLNYGVPQATAQQLLQQFNPEILNVFPA